jgi:hypothetical protein
LKRADFMSPKKFNPVEVGFEKVGGGDLKQYALNAGIKVDEYKAAVDKIIDAANKAGFDKDLSLSEIPKFKKWLRNPKMFAKGAGKSEMDPILQDVGKDFYNAVIERVEKEVASIPEARDLNVSIRKYNTEAKKLIDIKDIAEHKEFLEATKQGGKLPWFLGTGAVAGGAIPLIARQVASDPTTAILSALAATGGAAVGMGAKGLTTPGVMIPAGRGMQTLGGLLKGEARPPLLPGSAKQLKKEAQLPYKFLEGFTPERLSELGVSKIVHRQVGPGLQKKSKFLMFKAKKGR